jgi:hypothetical protein
VTDTGRWRSDHLAPPSAVVSIVVPFSAVVAQEVDDEQDMNPGLNPLGIRAIRATDTAFGGIRPNSRCPWESVPMTRQSDARTQSRSLTPFHPVCFSAFHVTPRSVERKTVSH